MVIAHRIAIDHRGSSCTSRARLGGQFVSGSVIVL